MLCLHYAFIWEFLRSSIHFFFIVILALLTCLFFSVELKYNFVKFSQNLLEIFDWNFLKPGSNLGKLHIFTTSKLPSQNTVCLSTYSRFPSPPQSSLVIFFIWIPHISWDYFQIFHLVISSVRSLSQVQLFAAPWMAACQASLSITNSRSLLRLMSTELVMIV